MASALLPPPLPGDAVGEYLLADVLGVGGMATVYRARHPVHGTVAVKILHPGKSGTEEERRFRREFLTLEALRHPGLVQVYEAGVAGDYPWIAMEYVDGVDLATLNESWQRQPPADRFQRAEHILRGLAEALVYVHGRGLVHRDIKPSNVLLTRAGDPKLTDFGVVKATSGAFTTQLTVAGRLVGTVAFMAPEQITGEPLDARADLYSLGAVFFELLTGERPIVADSIAGYLARHLTEEPRHPSELDPAVPARLERVCLRLLRKDPDQRFPSAQHVIAALNAEDGPVRPALHGRVAELESLLARVAELRGGAGGVLVVEGPEGSGRTALLTELLHEVRVAGVSVASASAADASPLARWAEQVSGDDPQLEPVERLARHTRGRPWLLVLDDLDHCGDAAITGLTALVRQQVAIEGEPLMVVVSLAQRGGLAGDFASGSATGLTPDLIELHGLDARATVALVRDRGLSGAAGVVLGRRLHQALGGMPGPVEEQLGALVRAGWLVKAADGAELVASRGVDALRADPLPVPDSLRAREAARLEQLAPPERAVYDAIVVLGGEVTGELVAEIVGGDLPAVESALHRVVLRGLLGVREDGIAEVFSIPSDRARDLGYGLVDPELRAQLHRAAGAALGRRSRRRSGAMAERIAHHLLRGGQPAQAYPLLLQAVRRRVRTGHWAAARVLLRQALDARSVAETQLDPSLSQRLRRQLFTLEGGLLQRAGELSAAAQAWRRAIEAADAEGDEDAQRHARAGLGVVLVEQEDLSGAAPWLEVALPRLQRGDPMWPQAVHALARVRLDQQRLIEAGARWTELLGHARAVGDVRAEGRALVGEGRIALCRGQLSDGLGRLERALQLLRTTERSPELCQVGLSLATLALLDGRLRDALDRLNELRDVGGLVALQVIRALGVEALVKNALGDEANAVRLAREGARLALAHGPVVSPAQIGASLSVARALCEVGETAEAISLLAESPGDVPGARGTLARLLAVQARAWASRDTAHATALAARALDLPSPVLRHQALRCQLDAALALEGAAHPSAKPVADSVFAASGGPGLRLLHLEAGLLVLRLGGSAPDVAALRAPLLGQLDEGASPWWS